jgi:hypothetical protein
MTPMMDNNTDDAQQRRQGTATQMTGDNADNNDAAADINTAMQTTR